MKKVLLFLLVSFLLTSCTLDCNYGYPHKIVFEKEGGTKICSGGETTYSIEITDYNGKGAVEEELTPDSIVCTYDWLIVKSRNYSSELIVTAAPNKTHKKRTLYISAWVDDSGADIKVVQH